MHGWTGQYFPEVDDRREKSATVVDESTQRNDNRRVVPRTRSMSASTRGGLPSSLASPAIEDEKKQVNEKDSEKHTLTATATATTTATTVTVTESERLMKESENQVELEMTAAAEAEAQEWADVQISDMARLTINPIRKVVRGEVEINPRKRPIVLSIGDPTVFGNLPVAKQVVDGALDALVCGKWHGYGPAVGLQSVREAVAKHCSSETSALTADDVVMAHGCSGALEFCITVLTNPGENILLPRPGFPIYAMLAEPLGIEVRYYDLLPEYDWEVDIQQMTSLIDEKTKAIVINNPSNPCGSVYSRKHLLEILQVAEDHFLPIISDDVYANFTFRGHEYHSLAALSKNVPILSCGALTKRFLLPNWRVGWVCLHDRNGVLKEVRAGMWQLATRLLGPATVMQAAVPHILEAVPQEYFDETVDKIYNAAKYAYESLSECRGLLPVMPRGAMYLMCGIKESYFPEFKNDVEWTRALMKEESVITLPATCFQYPNYFRIVLTAPIEHIKVACERIRNFCQRHVVEKEEIAQFNEFGMSAQSVQAKT